MKPEDLELIEQYLSGDLSPEQQRHFEERLSMDSELRNNLNLYNSIHKTMKEEDPLPNENELLQTLKQLNGKYFTTNVRQGFFKKWMAVVAAAAIIIMGGIYFLLPSKTSSEQLYAQFAQHNPLNIQSRGNRTDTIAQKAAIEFNKKNYRDALPVLEQYVQLQPLDIQMNFTLAECYLETGNYNDANRIFSSIANGQSAYMEAAKWYLALSALKQKDYTKCRNNLQNIPASSPYFSKAKELLQKLPG